jgi:multiple sugar transport system ATP-binding protein
VVRTRPEDVTVASSTVALIEVEKSFGSQRVIDKVSLEVAPAELVVFVGPSGCGKSTLLRLIAGLDAPDAGTIMIGGRDVTHVHPSKRGIAMVFQSYALYPHMSVADNMGFGLKIRGDDAATIARKVGEAARILQLEPLLARKPRELSGGQRQRVAIGRAIVREPEVFLFDEPLSNLDAALRGQMRVELARLHAQLQATMVYVTHDQVEAMTLADRIVVLNGGRVEQVGAPLALYQAPANRFVAGFIGAPSMNVLPARVQACADGRVALTLAGGAALTLARTPAPALAPDSAVEIGIRPEDIVLGGGEGRIRIAAGTVILVERLGGEALAHVRLEGAPESDPPLVVRVPGDAVLARGDAVQLAVDPRSCHLFDSTGQAVGRPQ